MTEDNLTKIGLKILKDKKGPLRIQGLNSIHPIQEALIALLKRQLTDHEIIQIIQDEGGLRKAIILDSLLEQLPEYRTQLKQNLTSIPLKDLIDKAALYLAEGKRTNSGEVLHRLSLQNNDRHFNRALRNANKNQIYIDTRELNRVNLAKERLKTTAVKLHTAGIIAASLLIAGGIFLTNYLNNKYEILRKDEIISIQLVNSERKKLSSLEERFSNLQTTHLKMQENYTTQIAGLEGAIKEQDKQYQNLELESISKASHSPIR